MESSKKFNTEYDMAAILQTGPKELLDLPDYTSKSIRVQKLEGRGRGIVAVADISPGQLLIVSKALAMVFPQDHKSESPTTLVTQVDKMRRLREAVMASIRKSPDLTSNIYNLYAGPSLGWLENGHVKIGVDLERIERICALNGFQGDGSPSACPYGLWYLPSFLNHTCYASNAHWRIFGHMLFVRSAKYIAKGEEILISYVDPNRPYSERRRHFLKHEFFCHCKLCELERKEGAVVRRERDAILEDFEDPNSGIECEYIVESLKDLRPEHPELNVFLIGPLLELGMGFYEKREFKTAAETFEKCFELCGASAQFNLVGISCALTVATCYLRLDGSGQSDLVQKWIDVSNNCVEIQYGAGSFASIAGIIRPSFVKNMQSAGFDLGRTTTD